jgi:hypothetical protein
MLMAMNGKTSLNTDVPLLIAGWHMSDNSISTRRETPFLCPLDSPLPPHFKPCTLYSSLMMSQHSFKTIRGKCIGDILAKMGLQSPRVRDLC